MKKYMLVLLVFSCMFFCITGVVNAQEVSCPETSDWECVSMEGIDESTIKVINDSPIDSIWYQGKFYLQDGIYDKFEIKGIGSTVVFLTDNPVLNDFGFQSKPLLISTPTVKIPSSTPTIAITPTSTSVITIMATPVAIVASKPSTTSMITYLVGILIFVVIIFVGVVRVKT